MPSVLCPALPLAAMALHSLPIVSRILLISALTDHSSAAIFDSLSLLGAADALVRRLVFFLAISLRMGEPGSESCHAERASDAKS